MNQEDVERAFDEFSYALDMYFRARKAEEGRGYPKPNRVPRRKADAFRAFVHLMETYHVVQSTPITVLAGTDE